MCIDIDRDSDRRVFFRHSSKQLKLIAFSFCNVCYCKIRWKCSLTAKLLVDEINNCKSMDDFKNSWKILELSFQYKIWHIVFYLIFRSLANIYWRKKCLLTGYVYIYEMNLADMQESKQKMKNNLFVRVLNINCCRIIRKYLFLKEFSRYHTRIHFCIVRRWRNRQRLIQQSE